MFRATPIRTLVGLAVLAVAGCPKGPMPPSGPKVVAKLSSAASFTAGSPVTVTVTLENAGSAPVTVAKPEITPNLVRFTVTNANGAELPFDGGLAKLRPFGAGDFVDLAPAATVTHDFDLAGSYKFAPGGYTVKAVYRNNDDGRAAGVSAFTTTGIPTNSIQFNIQ